MPRILRYVSVIFNNSFMKLELYRPCFLCFLLHVNASRLTLAKLSSLSETINLNSELIN